jgi:ferredoxin
MPLGGDWLTLEVPSIEMVSVGWALQILAAGVSVRLIGCDDDGCNVRAREIAQLCASLIDAAALELGQPPSISANADPPNSIRSSSRAVTLSRESVGAVAFREPEASVSALSLVGTAKSDGVKRDSRASWLDEAVDTKPGRPWRIESTLLPFGEVTVDESLCSACGRCAFVCASGAPAMEDVSDAVIALTLDSHACSACEVCVLSCPEGAITLRRVASAERLIPHRIRVKIVNQLKCVACGSKLAGGLATSVISERLASSHPQLANRLLTEVKCADCMLAR